MRTYLLSLFAMLALVPVLLAQDFNLPAKIEAKVGAENIVFINKITAKDIQYKVYSENKFEITREPLDDPTVILFKFKPLTPGKYTLVVAGALGDKTFVRDCIISAGGGTGPVDPPPTDPLESVRGDLSKLLKAVGRIGEQQDQLASKMTGLESRLLALDARVSVLETKKIPDPPVGVLAKKVQHAWTLTPTNEKAFIGKARAFFSQMAILVNDPKLKTVGDLKEAMEVVRKSPLVLGDDGKLQLIMNVLGVDMDGMLPHNTGVVLDAALRARYSATFSEYAVMLGGLQP